MAQEVHEVPRQLPVLGVPAHGAGTWRRLEEGHIAPQPLLSVVKKENG